MWLQQSSFVRIVVQRVTRASVSVGGEVCGSIERGLLLLVAIEPTDARRDIEQAADKVINLRVFADSEGRMNLSLKDTAGSALVVSQFTLLGEVRRGRRPSFSRAADPALAEPMVDQFVGVLRAGGIETETGVFGAAMTVELVNDGPVTIVIDVRDGRVS
jgi:D-tyrosyl-tRNA(Tyr) deacylase